MSDQLVAEAATLTTHNKHKRRIPMATAAFEPTRPAIFGPNMCALNSTAIGIGVEVATMKTKYQFHIRVLNGY
jgi:hypothetical protein